MPVLILLLLILLIPVNGWSAPALTVWIGDDKGVQGLTDAARRYQQETGTQVRVRALPQLPSRFEAAAREGGGPDILLWAHDRYGEWAERGLLAPISPGKPITNAIAPFTWQAVTYQEQRWGYPLAVEAVTLVYNRKLIPAPPPSFEAMIPLDQALRASGLRAISWPYTSPYFSWPLLAAGGAFAFAETGTGTGTGYDTGHTGLDSPGAQQGAALLRRLREQGVLEKGDSAAPFLAGQAAMTIAGPWQWAAFRDAGIDFAVAPLPPVNGNPGVPFVGVWAAAINANSDQQAEARNFVENYLLQPEGLNALNRASPLGAPANIELMGVLAANPHIDTTFHSAVTGQMMPNIPEMRRFWQALRAALEATAHTDRPIAPILLQAAEQATGRSAP
ncbi:maltose/maltodextrin ABC transporter substrate-binding protein MalE [Motiliproteus sp. SC1-56]|uniref:maltose/maltodextrin ABC transporter substrate-binding protein MalE n=1 Tax=Motiliproteus sp. SC1-56 TaxID=2799565 RepID=UPI001A8E9EEF|nr:maltose/maltodextrin ABC transporter substrate-binding protein MalE [Motiliproteus sp. SC1-56]